MLWNCFAFIPKLYSNYIIYCISLMSSMVPVLFKSVMEVQKFVPDVYKLFKLLWATCGIMKTNLIVLNVFLQKYVNLSIMHSVCITIALIKQDTSAKCACYCFVVNIESVTKQSVEALIHKNILQFGNLWLHW